jgi:hypothetical protein
MITNELQFEVFTPKNKFGNRWVYRQYDGFATAIAMTSDQMTTASEYVYPCRSAVKMARMDAELNRSERVNQ